jgi:hypothetical protein
MWRILIYATVAHGAPRHAIPTPPSVGWRLVGASLVATDLHVTANTRYVRYTEKYSAKPYSAYTTSFHLLLPDPESPR